MQQSMESCTGGPTAFAIKADKLLTLPRAGREMEGTAKMVFFFSTEIGFIFPFGQTMHVSVGVFILIFKGNK